MVAQKTFAMMFKDLHDQLTSRSGYGAAELDVLFPGGWTDVRLAMHPYDLTQLSFNPGQSLNDFLEEKINGVVSRIEERLDPWMLIIHGYTAKNVFTELAREASDGRR